MAAASAQSPNNQVNSDPQLPLVNWEEGTAEFDSRTSHGLQTRVFRQVPDDENLEFTIMHSLLGPADDKLLVDSGCLEATTGSIHTIYTKVFISLELNQKTEPPIIVEKELVHDGYMSFEQLVFDIPTDRDETFSFSFKLRIEPMDFRCVMFEQITVRPKEFPCLSGQFVLESNEREQFYVHYLVMEQHSPPLKTCMMANHDNMRNGQPYPVKCSTQALRSLLKFIYMEYIDTSFPVNMSEIVAVAHLLEMNKCVGACVEVMNDRYEDQDFDTLMRWFLAAAELSLDDSKLEVKIMKKLSRMSQGDEQKRGMIMSQMMEYMKLKPSLISEVVCDLMCKE